MDKEVKNLVSHIEESLADLFHCELAFKKFLKGIIIIVTHADLCKTLEQMHDSHATCSHIDANS